MEPISIEQACREYADLKSEEKRIKARLEFLQETIQPQVETSGVIEQSYGVFKPHNTTKYKYSDGVNEAQEALNIRKDKEKKAGIAEKIVTTSMQFRPAKQPV